MSTRQQILDGIAFALWAHALAGAVKDRTRERMYDQLIYHGAEPPPEVMEPANEIATLYEDANGKTIEAMYRMDPAGLVDDERHKLEPRDYGSALGNNALNTASPLIAVSPVTFEISLDDDDVLTWTGDVGDPRAEENPASMMTAPGWQTARDKLASSAAKGKRNPPGGPTRQGEQSRFRKTLRGHTRTTAVIPRARYTTSETGKRQYTLAEMLSANADSPAVCDRIKSMEPGATIHVDIGGGQVRVKRVA